MKALVLSGGGARGSYQAGALKYLIGDLGHKYDIVCGISVGALNCGFLSMFPKEKEVDALRELVDIWENISTPKVHKRWFPFGRLHCLWEKSLYNSQPLIDLVRSRLDINSVRASGKMVGVGAVSLSTGKFRMFTQDDDSFVDGVLASSSFPAFLTPIEIDGEWWSDGGIKEVTPLKQAIDFGATEIDVIMCSPLVPSEAYNENSNTIDVAMRAIGSMNDEVMVNDIKIAQMYNELIALGAAGDKRIIDIKMLYPDAGLDIDSLTFDHDKIMKLIAQGYEEAKTKYGK